MKYLIVCTGNTCRSPMGEAILRSLVDAGDEVRSAGTSALSGVPCTTEAEAALAEIGLKSSGTSSRLNADLLSWADLIVCMTASHRDRVLAIDPTLAGKVLTLGEWAGEPAAEIEDPVGLGLKEYRAARDAIRSLLEKAVKREKRDHR